MKMLKMLVSWSFGLVMLGGTGAASAQSFSEGFNGNVVPTGWVLTNLSTRASTGNLWGTGPGITDGDGNIVVAPYEGDTFIIANYTSIGSGTGTINNWLISPQITGIKNGDTFSFYTTTTPAAEYPDRLEFRLSTAGSSTNVGTTTTSVGDFTTVLSTINPNLTVGGYPETWTLVSVTVSGLTQAVNGRVALRYFVTSGGPTGANSNIVGVDAFSYVSSSGVASPSLAVSSSSNPSGAGTSVTFTATLSAANSPTGTVTFCADATTTNAACTGGSVLCTAPANVTPVVCTTSSLSLGTHPISAYFAGDVGNNAATSPALSQVVNLQAQTITFTSIAPNNAVIGRSYTVTATASSGLAVTFAIDAASTAGACSIAGSVVTFTGPGTCIVDANQAGDPTYAAASQAQQAIALGDAIFNDGFEVP